LTFAHREALKVLADHARHNGLAWPGMPTIAKQLGVKERQAFRIIADLELADLVKIHEGGGRGHSNHYWVRVPWVQEPERVLDLPLLDNKHYPLGARLKCDESGKVIGIDVEYYVRFATLKTLSPVTGESPSLRESSSSFEPPSSARAARKQVEENDEDERETANVQPTLPRFEVLSVPGNGPAPTSWANCWAALLISTARLA